MTPEPPQNVNAGAPRVTKYQRAREMKALGYSNKEISDILQMKKQNVSRILRATMHDADWKQQITYIRTAIGEIHELCKRILEISPEEIRGRLAVLSKVPQHRRGKRSGTIKP